jgi:hypothetical protein
VYSDLLIGTVLHSRSIESSKKQVQVNLKFVDSTVGRELQAYCLLRRATKVAFSNVFADTRCLQGGANAIRRQRHEASTF